MRIAVTYGLRFWSKIRKGGPSECWEWQASLDGRGYGQFSVETEPGKWVPRRAHRIVWELRCGDTGGLHVLHRCDNRKCCNPSHLFLGSNADNIRDRVAKGRSGGRPWFAKLKPDQVKMIRASGARTSLLASTLGVSEATIRRARAGRTWKSCG